MSTTPTAPSESPRIAQTLTTDGQPPHLNTPPPPAVAEALRKLGVEPAQLIISIDTDVDLVGDYRTQWLTATSDKLFVFDEAKPAEPLLVLGMSESSEFRTIAVVGSGLVQAKVQGVWLDLIRYSNRLKYFFGRAATRLDQIRKGEPVTLEKEDQHDPRRCPTCDLMLEFEGETCPRCINRGRAISRVFQLMKPYWVSAICMMALLVVGVSLDMIGPRLTQFLVDNVVVGSDKPHTDAETANKLHLLTWVVCGLAGLQILRVITTITNGRIASRVGTQITHDIRCKLVNHMQQLSLSYYDKQQTGSLVGRVAYDTEAVQGFMSQLTSGFLMQILMVILAAVGMFSLDPHLAMWTLLPAPFVFCGTFIFYRFVYPKYDRYYDRSSRQAGMLNGLLSGIRVVKAFAQEDREYERFRESSNKLQIARQGVDIGAATFYPIMGLVFQIGGWLVWYIGGSEVIHTKLSVGKLMAFFGYLGLFYAPLNALAHLTTWVTQFSTQIQRIFEVLDTPIAISNVAKPVQIPLMKGDIEFKKVTFGYSRQTPILKQVNLQINAGQTVGIVGRSGSGKTTIINLISRFYDVDEGSILIDGAEIKRISTNDVRRQIGVVLQEPFLFRGTLWENLAYGRTNATVEEVIAASRAGNSHDLVMKQMYAYDTWVGERGAGLSGGERQRLSIARAILCEPRILILDEATSSVDSESELAIQTALAKLVKGRTSIIIAHRLSTLRNCDKILVVDDGRIAENGTHDELMKLDGKYAKLVKIQGSSSPTDSIDSLNEQEKERKIAEEAVKPISTASDINPDTGLPAITSHIPRWLSPDQAVVHLGTRNALHVTIKNERIYNGVFALRCLPVRFPNQYISLRYTNSENREQEVGLIKDLSVWPAEAQKLIEASLQRRYLVHHITEVIDIEQFGNYLSFKVVADGREMEFIQRWSYSTAQDYGQNGKVLVDVEENRYLIPDTTKLPSPGNSRFHRYIYW